MNTDSRKQINYILLFMFGGSVVLRFLLSNFYPKTIHVYPDELLYMSMGESLWFHHDIRVFHVASYFQKLAYPLLLAPTFAITDLKIRGMLIALVNSVLMSLGSFPVYGLAKRILRKRKWVMFCVVLYLISPTMTYSMTYMSENLSVPLSLWFVYLVYRIWEEKDKRKTIELVLVALIVMVLCYMTKSISFVFPVALVLVVLTEWMFYGNKKKRILAGVLGCIGMAAGAWIGCARLFPADILEKIPYVLYGCVFFLVITVLGFCVIPIVLPGLCYKKLDKNAKKLYLFLIYVVLVTAVIVSCMIYAVEDYPSWTPRAHLRYVEFLFVPFVIVLLRVFELEDVMCSRRRIWLNFAFWAVSLIAVFHGFSGQTVDQTMLFYWQLFAKDGRDFNPFIVMGLDVVVIGVVALYFKLYFRNQKKFKRVLILGLVIMCIGNTALSVYVQYRTHRHKRDELAEMEEVRNFVLEHKDENFLVLEDRGYSEMIDTYLMDCHNVRTGLVPVLTQRDECYELPRDISYAIVLQQGYSVASDAQCLAKYPKLWCSLYQVKNGKVLGD